MATMGFKNGQWGPLSLIRFFDSNTPSMRKVDDGKKTGKRCSGIAQDATASDAIIVENDKPNDDLPLLVGIERHDQLVGVYSSKHTVAKFILRALDLMGGNLNIILTRT